MQINHCSASDVVRAHLWDWLTPVKTQMSQSAYVWHEKPRVWNWRFRECVSVVFRATYVLGENASSQIWIWTASPNGLRNWLFSRNWKMFWDSCLLPFWLKTIALALIAVSALWSSGHFRQAVGMETRSPFVGPRMLKDACELAKAAIHNQSQATTDLPTHTIR